MQNQVSTYLESIGIVQRFKDNLDRNAIGVVDKAIQSIKQITARMMAEDGTHSWADVLPRATAAYNKTPKVPLHGDAPEEVHDDPQVKFMLLQDNARALQHNQTKTDKKATTLQDTQEFRAPLPGATSKFKRSFQPTYGDVKKVQSISGSTVTAQDGSHIDLKYIKIVPANSKEPVRMEQSSARTARQVKILEPFADHLKKALAGTVSGARALDILQRGRGFRAAVAEARLNKKALVKNFVDLFPDLFKHEMRQNTFYVSPVSSLSR